MNETANNQIERKIRKYKTKQVKDGDLKEIVSEIKQIFDDICIRPESPDSFKVIVLQNKKMIEKLSKINAIVTGKDTDSFYGAPTVIVILEDETKVKQYSMIGETAIKLINNKTKIYGVDSEKIIGVKEDFETEEGKELLEEWNVSDNYIGVGYCILGYFNEEYFKPKPKKEASITIIK